MKRAMLATLVLVLLPLTAAGHAAAATSKPTPTGTLTISTISGPVQDGATLSATGVTWTPSPCTTQGVCSRALTVSYSWRACRGTTCSQPSIPSDQPVVNTLLLGPGDVGRTIRVTETAT